MIPDVTQLLETAGLPMLLAAAFGGGLVLSATPFARLGSSTSTLTFERSIGL